MPGAPFTSWLTLLFLFSVLVLMAFDYPNGTYTIGSIPLLAVLLVAGWFGVRKRVHEIHSTAPTLRSNWQDSRFVHRGQTGRSELNYLQPAATHRCC